MRTSDLSSYASRGKLGSLAIVLLVAACSAPSARQDQALANEQRALATAPKFFCAQGDAPLAAQCTAERTRTDAGWVLTLRHPDGHFRRLLVKDDNSVTAADGAQPASVTVADGQIDVAVAADRYRLPATR